MYSLLSFTCWCNIQNHDAQFHVVLTCSICVISSFLQSLFDHSLSYSTLKVHDAAISACKPSLKDMPIASYPFLPQWDKSQAVLRLKPLFRPKVIVSLVSVIGEITLPMPCMCFIYLYRLHPGCEDVLLAIYLLRTPFEAGHCPLARPLSPSLWVHLTRGIATSWALFKGFSVEDICTAPWWSSACAFVWFGC